MSMVGRELWRAMFFYDYIVGLVQPLPSEYSDLQRHKKTDTSVQFGMESNRDKQRLGSLRVLTLRGNQIDVLPGEITRLKSLNIFLMDNNKLSVLPDELGESLCLLHVVSRRS